ncbi:hypothetical protein N0O92_04355 [Alkalihalobacillus sp. MEB130]|uniref:hypothetical protein n=1 Tax=Alkalihalobacillus sp. MEB130 TaxID=2976704 RepID=UPI0028E01DFE|nr:hypothetical protein [Alkalihalobacillus sp. MEB130]MDT8859456.1 hypothetical protein [Alkalihalobacillus sp. MEB130]
MNIVKSLFFFACFLAVCTACQTEEVPNETLPENEELEPITDDELGQTIEEPKEETSSFEEIVNEFKPLSDYDMYHDGTGLGEGMTFLAKNKSHALALGHQAQAVAFYRILEINKENEQIIITHEFKEDSEPFDSINEALDMGEDPVQLLEDYLEEDHNENKVFFYMTDQREEVSLMSGEEVTTLPVEMNDTVYHFAKEQGLVRIHYKGELVIELFGDEQIAEKNPYH